MSSSSFTLLVSSPPGPMPIRVREKDLRPSVRAYVHFITSACQEALSSPLVCNLEEEEVGDYVREHVIVTINRVGSNILTEYSSLGLPNADTEIQNSTRTPPPKQSSEQPSTSTQENPKPKTDVPFESRTPSIESLRARHADTDTFVKAYVHYVTLACSEALTSPSFLTLKEEEVSDYVMKHVILTLNRVGKNILTEYSSLGLPDTDSTLTSPQPQTSRQPSTSCLKKTASKTDDRSQHKTSHVQLLTTPHENLETFGKAYVHCVTSACHEALTRPQFSEKEDVSNFVMECVIQKIKRVGSDILTEYSPVGLPDTDSKDSLRTSSLKQSPKQPSFSCLKKNKLKMDAPSQPESSENAPVTESVDHSDLVPSVKAYVYFVTSACQEALISPEAIHMEEQEVDGFVKGHVATVINRVQHNIVKEFLSLKVAKTHPPDQKPSKASASSMTKIGFRLQEEQDTPAKRPASSPTVKRPLFDLNAPTAPTKTKRSKHVKTDYRPRPFMPYQRPVDYRTIPPLFTLPTHRPSSFNARWSQRHDIQCSDEMYLSPPSHKFKHEDIVKFSYHLLKKHYFPPRRESAFISTKPSKKKK